jgi:RES domain-containing protein
MNFWRISRFHDLSGFGTVKTFGRWHREGSRMIYTADSPAGALLEICAYTSLQNAPPTFTLLKITGPEEAAEETQLSQMPSDWVSRPELTQALGSEWLDSQRTALLRVPSALVPESWNYLLNPLHPNAGEIRIEHVYEYPFDLRLKG